MGSTIGLPGAGEGEGKGEVFTGTESHFYKI
jgi:hypothetical protein